MNTPLTKTLLFLLLGKPREAILECDEGLSGAGTPNPVLYFIRGLAHADRSEFQNALNDLAHFIESVSETEARLYGYLARAEVYVCLKDSQKALEALKAAEDTLQLRQTHRDELKNRRTLIEGQRDAERESDVRASAPQIVTPPPRLDNALDELVTGNLEQGLSLAEAVCEQQKNAIDPVFVRGLAKDLRGRRAKKASDPENADSDVEAAIQDYSRVIEAEGTPLFLMKAYERRALLFLSQRKNKEAFDDLNEVLVSEPQNINARLHRAIAALREREYKTGQTDINAILQMDPQNVQAWQLQGELDLLNQNYDAALNCFEKAVRYCPEETLPRDNLTRIVCLLSKAFTLYLKKDYAAALEVFQDVVPTVERLTERQRNTLQPKMDILLSFLPQLEVSENLSERERKENPEKSPYASLELLEILPEDLMRQAASPNLSEPERKENNDPSRQCLYFMLPVISLFAQRNRGRQR